MHNPPTDAANPALRTFLLGSWRWHSRIRNSYDLGTTSEAAAKIKLKRLVSQTSPEPTDARRHETFRDAAERIVRRQSDDPF